MINIAKEFPLRGQKKNSLNQVPNLSGNKCPLMPKSFSWSFLALFFGVINTISGRNRDIFVGSWLEKVTFLIGVLVGLAKGLKRLSSF